MTHKSPLDPLAGIDQVPWKKLSHACGTAEDIPELLRQLRSADLHVRQDARKELYGNLWHQHTVYGATSRAVPFLIRLAADALTPERALILIYLADLFQGKSYRQVHGNVPALDVSEHESRLAKELKDVEDVRSAVIEGVPEFVQLLNTGDSAIQLATAYLLGLTQVEITGDEDEEVVISEEIHLAAVGDTV